MLPSVCSLAVRVIDESSRRLVVERALEDLCKDTRGISDIQSLRVGNIPHR